MSCHQFFDSIIIINLPH